MSPPTTTHSLCSLETEIKYLPNGKPRKPQIDLSDCALKELVQYKCNITTPAVKEAQPKIICEPVVRLLRLCGNGLSVETTAWEGWKAKRDGVKVDS